MDKKNLLVGISSLAVVALAILFFIWFAKPASFRGTSYAKPYPVAPRIELIRSNGETFRLSDQKGKVVLIFFGYTFCPDVCPTTLAELKLATEQLGGKAQSVQVIFVTVDPERDTPEKIQTYVEKFSPKFIGLSGSLDQLQKIWNDYGIFRKIAPAENSTQGYGVDHTARVTLIDPDGNLRLTYGLQTPVEDIVHDINLLIK